MMTATSASTGTPTRVERVMADLRQRIERGAIGPGARLPSIRRQAEVLGVSRSTVVEAYARLVAEGLIASHPGSGFYVGTRRLPLALAEQAPGQPPDRDPVWVTRQSLLAEAAGLKPGAGWLPETWMPEADIRRALRRLSRQPLAPLTGYGTPQGSPALRALLAARLAARGITVAPAQLMLTESSTQAIDLVCRFLLQPGDTVLVDDPCYFSFQAMLRAHRVEVAGVPWTPQGPDLTALETTLAERRPRLYVTNSVLHNPTGASLSAEVAHRVLMLAERHDLTIVEDDVFADFEPQPTPRLAALDGLQRVIYVGSFSKSLSASVRVGHLAARADWIGPLVDLKLATAFEPGHFSAGLLHLLLAGGSYQRHMRGLRSRLGEAMGRVLERLQQLGLQPWLRPQAGMFVWCALPAGIDAAALAQHALQAHRMVLAPGNGFSPLPAAAGYMRFNVAQCLNPAVWPALEASLDALAPR